MTGKPITIHFQYLSETEKEFIKMDSQKDFGVTGFDFGSMGGYYTLAEIEADLDEMFSAVS